MADNWQAIPGYASNNYTDTMVFEVDGATKQLQKISGQTLIAGEKNSQYIRFMMPRYWDGIDVSNKNIRIIYDLNNSTYFGGSEAVGAERTDDKIRFGWVVPAEACAVKGMLLFVIIVQDSGYVLKTQITETPVLKSLNENGDIPEPTKELWYRDFQVRIESTLSAAENAVEEAQTVLEQARKYVGAPLVARTAEEMEDTSRVYVYTGSETGYTSGHWYYHDGEQWTDGGVYNSVAVDTDTTLSISGMAADAKETGDQITELKSGLNDLINSAYVTDSASGSVAHFVDGADGVPMKSVKVNIAPAQSGSGDPSPSNVRAISGFDSVKVTRIGKNLFAGFNDGSKSYETGITVTFSNTFHVSISGTTNGTNVDTPTKTLGGDNETPILFEKGKTYVASLDGNVSLSGSNKIRLILQTDTTLKWYGDTASGVWVITPNDDFTVNRLRFRLPTNGTVVNIDADFQIEVGSEATEFEPYNGDVYEVSLASAGTVYGGTLDVVSGVLTVDKVATVGLNSYRKASGVSDGGLNYYDYAPNNYKLTEAIISSHLAMKTGESAWASATPCATANATRLRLYIEADTESSYADMVVVYTLATPLTYNLTPTEVKSLLGINNIWSDAGDVDVEYRADTKLYIKRLTGSDTDMIADANITSGQYFMAGNDLYRATVNIASGAQIVVGTNATKVSLSEALNQIKEA